MQLRSTGFGVLAGAVMFMASCSSDEVDLKFDPATASKYRMEMTKEQHISQEMMGRKMEVSSTSDISMLYEVGKADGDNKEMKMVFDKMKVTQRAMGQDMVMDSDGTDTLNPATRILHAIKGSEFNMKVNAKGEMSQITGAEEMMNKMVAASGSNLTPEQQAEMKEGLKGIMSEEMLKGMTEQSFKIYPGKKVKAGDKWSSKSSMKSMIDMELENSYELKKVEKGIAYINVTSKLTTGTPEKTVQGTKVETNLTGTQTGTMQVEVSTGITLSSVTTQKLSGKMKANGMEIPMNIDGTTTIKMIKL